MDRVFVSSSSLASVLYFPNQRRLDVEFRSGAAYRYFDVPLRAYSELLTAESIGGYFNANIRNRFPCQQIQGLPGAAASATPKF
jgi:hypothetical protein